MLEALRGEVEFWREKGVDGFRFDAMQAYFSDESFADNSPASPEVRARMAGPSYRPCARQDHVFDMLPGDGAKFVEHLHEWAGRDAYLLGEIGSGNQTVELVRAFAGDGRLDSAYAPDLSQGGPSPELIADILTRLEGERCHAFLLS